uniref:GNAT family N-acetyltransferase n=1 Tax=Agathobacter sp. TaxID=2021311 RepID=UPI00405620BC
MDITVIRKENQSYFMPLMPESIWKETDLALGAIVDGTACGILAVSAEEANILFLQHLFVDEGFRRRGVATALLNELYRIAKESKTDLCYCQYVEDEVTEGIKPCLTSNSYEQEQWKNPVYVTAFGDLPKKIFERKIKISNGNLSPLSEVTNRAWNGLLKKMEMLPNEEGTVPELKPKAVYDQKVSFLLMNNGEAEGCILFEKEEEAYILAYFCMLKRTASAEMMGLFLASYEAMKTLCSDDTPIYINALTQTAQKMAVQMTEGKAKEVGAAVTLYRTY